MVNSIFLLLKRWSCPHKNMAKKRRPIEGTDLYLLYTECLDCGKSSPGIETGGYHKGGYIAA